MHHRRAASAVSAPHVSYKMQRSLTCAASSSLNAQPVTAGCMAGHRGAVSGAGLRANSQTYAGRSQDYMTFSGHG